MCNATTLLLGTDDSPPSPADVALRAAPTAVIALVWLGVEALRSRRVVPKTARRQGLFLGVVAAGVLGYLVWLGFAPAPCWQVTATAAASALGLLLLVLPARLAALLALLLAAGTIVAESFLTPDLVYYGPVQHLWLLYVSIALSHLPGRARRLKVATTSAVDPLAKKERETACEVVRPTSWFA